MDAFEDRARANQLKLQADLKSHYDFIVCGSGSSGSVVARRLAEPPGVSVLLLEAGGSDDVPAVMNPLLWPTNLGTERDWGFHGVPNPRLNGRALPLSMGKVLGGGSSINASAWSRGHRNDWDYFAQQTDDAAWGYESVLAIYRRIEDWQGTPDPRRRGTGGLVHVEPAQDPNPIAPAMLEGARSVGIPTFDDQNGEMMEGDGGCAIANLRIRDGKRQSIFRTYVHPLMDRPNLTVLTQALVTRITFAGKRATGVEFVFDGRVHRIGAAREVVLSLGAMHTPKVLMQSGIGDQADLGPLGIEMVQHAPGVGRNFQDHIMVAGCLWEYETPLPPRNSLVEATFFWKSDASLDTPDLQPFQIEAPYVNAETARLNPPAGCWSIGPGLVRPRSHGRIRLTGPDPMDPLEIDANTLGDPADLKALLTCIELCREIGNSAALRPFVKREVMPGGLRGAALEHFVRDAIVTYFHQACTARMGLDEMSVVDGRLRVHGIDNLRIADGSVMPRVTTGNTMAPCVVIGERAAELLKATHGL
ncbi:choline dehydrogenase [Inquilinus ginsengisoli]|uniref:Choline dehydrogenase n=1 Tax=Inquilinus ginsengisoli TaxID=363840 RepID=A0ABU1K1L4_9PROT|nr:GMC family oxidoreductase [Inquilinus ginsengisoli]MDR6294402.1 choline dehydrogenase [Inquilinus ginsengisoli]